MTLKTQSSGKIDNPANSEVAVEEKPRILAGIDVKNKKTWVLCHEDGGMLEIENTADPEYGDSGARIVGIPVLPEGKEKIEGRVIGELIPYLETKFEGPGVEITIANIPFQILNADDKAREVLLDTFYGKNVKLDELVDTNAIIVRIAESKTIVLSTPMPNQKERSVLVYKDSEDAERAMLAFKSFPPFKKDAFHKKSEVVTLGAVDKAELGDELFIYYDVWQKSVTLLSAHMKQ